MRFIPAFILIGILVSAPFGGFGASDSLFHKRCEAIFEDALPLLSHRGGADNILLAADSLEKSALKAGALDYLGRAYYLRGVALSYQHETIPAMEDFRKALRCFESSRDSALMGRTYYSLAAHAYQNEELERAQKQAQKAMQIAQQQGDTVLRANSLNLFALVQKALGNYQTAIDYLEQSSEGIGIHHRIKLLQNLGVIYKDLEQFDDAERCFLQIVQFLADTPDHPSFPIALNNLATVKLRQGQAEKALIHLQQARNALGDRPSPRLLVLLDLNQGYAYAETGNCKAALPYYRKARAALEGSGRKQDLVTALENEAACLRDLGQAALAYDLLQRSQNIQDSLEESAHREAVAKMEQEFRQAEQRQRIERLEEHNRLILEREAASRHALRNQRFILILLAILLLLFIFIGILVNRVQKSRLLAQNEAGKQQLLRQQIKPHFIFNALNSVQHFLIHDRKKEAMSYLGKFGALLRLILHNAEKDLVSVAEEFQLLRKYLEMEQVRASYKFDFEINVDAGINPENVLMPGMVLQVIAENAIWHGASKSAGKGMIRVGLRKAGDAFVVSVEDNGPGLPKDEKSGSLHKSLGLSLVRNRLERSSKKGLSFGFELENTTGDGGNVLGTQARIFLRGSSILA